MTGDLDNLTKNFRLYGVVMRSPENFEYHYKNCGLGKLVGKAEYYGNVFLVSDTEIIKFSWLVGYLHEY